MLKLKLQFFGHLMQRADVLEKILILGMLCKEVSHKQQPSGTPEKRRTSLIPRPKSPNMQDLKRRFKQALSAKVRTVTSV